MDPISRREVWEILEAAKPGRAIIHTTHSMEEADVLGDRIGIMARGHLRCLGSSVRLKARFGAGLNLAISVVPTSAGPHDAALLQRRADGVKRFVLLRMGLAHADETLSYIQALLLSALPDIMFFTILKMPHAMLRHAVSRTAGAAGGDGRLPG